MNKKLTLTRKQYNELTQLKNNATCLADYESKISNYLYNTTDITTFKHGYCSNEYKKIQFVASAIYNNVNYITVLED